MHMWDYDTCLELQVQAIQHLHTIPTLRTTQDDDDLRTHKPITQSEPSYQNRPEGSFQIHTATMPSGAGYDAVVDVDDEVQLHPSRRIEHPSN